MLERKRNLTNNAIDFVITWVNGNDPEWRKEKSLYSGDAISNSFELDIREERYRDWDNLQYWFRGVEKFAPWVRKIHFVTWGHLPKWLNLDNPKLHIVNHKDYIPKTFLPTFNSHTIEWNFHRISGLSEHFVYFNDDIFLLQKVEPGEFFKGGKPVDMLALQPDVANADDQVMPYIYLNNAMVLAKYFDKRENMKKQPEAYFHIGYPLQYFIYNILETAFPRFTGFYTVHGPSPLKKKTYETLWKMEPELLNEVCSHKFREKSDISQYVLREYQKLSGDFIPRNIQKLNGYYEISNENETLLQAIKGQKKKILCLNDANCNVDFEKIEGEIRKTFDQILPEKSSFEI